MKTKKLLAVDIDNVLASFSEAFIDYANKSWGTSITINDYTEDWGSLFNIDQAEWTRRTAQLLSDEEFYNNLPIVPNAQKALAELHEHYRIIAVTSRGQATKKATYYWLNKHFLGLIDQIHLAGFYDKLNDGHNHKQTKGDICKSLKIDYFIDDEPKHCLSTAEHEISAILFGNYVWNKNITQSPFVQRAENWAKATSLLTKDSGKCAS
jgi:5'(3')-deoxyribonucleotidase